MAFKIDERGLFHPHLLRIRRLAAICAYGEDEQAVARKGDAPQRLVRDIIGRLIAPDAQVQFFGHYGMNFSNAARRRGFLDEVARAFANW